MDPFRGVCLLFLLCLLKCSFIKSKEPPLLLKVGNKTWNLEEYKKPLQDSLKNLSPIEKKSREDFKTIKQEIVQDLILKTLIENWAQKNKIKITKKHTKKKETFYDKNISLKDLNQHRLQKSYHEALLNHLSQKIPKPSLAEQKSYYLKNKRAFYTPSSCFLEQILVSSESLAKKLLLQIKAGSPFSKLKFLHSLKPDVGWVEKGGLKAFDQACQLDILSLSPVLKSPYGYHIFKVIKKKPAMRKKFSQVQPEILKILTEKPKKKAFQIWLKTELSKTSVFINKKLLDKIDIQYKRNLL